MRYEYFTPFYLPSLELFTPWQDEFGDCKTQFIRLKYRINKDCFKSQKNSNLRVSKRLDFDIRSYTGNRILGGLNKNGFYDVLNIGPTFVLSAEAREIGDFYDTITETYVPLNLNYNKSIIDINRYPYFDTFSTQSVNFYGREEVGNDDLPYDYTFPNKVELVYDSTNKNVKVLGMDITSGDFVIFDRPYKYYHEPSGTNYYTYYHLRSEAVQAIDDNTVPLSFEWSTINDATGEATPAGSDTMSIIDAQHTHLGDVPVFAVFYKRVRNSRMETVNVKTRTQFFTEQPNIITRTKIVDSAGNEVALKKSNTQIQQDKGMYGVDGNNGYGYVIEDSAISFDKEIGLWRRDTKLANWKLA